MASLTCRRNKYYARINDIVIEKGKKKRKPFEVSLNTDSKEVALQLLPRVEVKEKLFQSRRISKEELILQLTDRSITSNEELINQFNKYKKSTDHISKKMESEYKNALNLVLEVMGGRDIKYITAEDIIALMTAIDKKKNAVDTKNKYVKNCKTFFNWGIKYRKIVIDFPIEMRKFPKDKKYPKYFTQKELDQIFQHILEVGNMELYHRVKLHLNTGMRLDEFSNANLEGNFLELSKTKTRVDRTIQIDNEAIESYQYLQNIKNSHKDTISKAFKEILEKLNLRFTKDQTKRSFHSLRHTFAVMKYLEIGKIYDVKLLLGHSNISTTEIYSNFQLGELERDFPDLAKKDNTQLNREPNTQQQNDKNSTQKAPHIQSAPDFNVPPFINYTYSSSVTQRIVYT